MENSREFIAEWFEQKYLTFGELCAGYGVSRKTGYKWVGRFKEHGLSGLQERRRGTGSHPWTTDDAMVQQVVALRRKRPRWGPLAGEPVALAPQEDGSTRVHYGPLQLGRIDDSGRFRIGPLENVP